MEGWMDGWMQVAGGKKRSDFELRSVKENVIESKSS